VSRAIDPVTLTVVRNALEQVADEMDLLLYRAAFSTIISEGRDACSGLYDAETGATLIQGKFGLPVFVGVMGFAVREAIERAREQGAAPGDIFITNDPARTGTHLQDVKLVKPFFYGGAERPFCWMANTGHWTDVGGGVPGGFNPKATEVFQEGFRIRPVKLYEGGRLSRAVLDLMLGNTRTPTIAYGDLSAQLGALEMGERRLAALLDKFGAETVRAVMAELTERAGRMMRSHIAAIPDGTYSFEDHLDNDGIVDEPLRVALDLTVSGEQMRLDFSRSSAPCAGPYNMPLATSIASCYIALKHIFTDVPANAGVLAPLEFVIPECTFLNVGGDKPMSGYTETTPVIIGAIWGALGQAAPERANAAYFATVNSLNVAGYRDDGSYYVMFTYHGGGHGASPESDGLNHGSNAISMATIAPVEILEGNFPIRYRQWALRPDSGGAGLHRGGLGSIYSFEVLGRGARAFFLGDRGKFRPFGIAGGGPGLPNEILFRHGDRVERPAMLTKATDVVLAPGDVVELRTPGGGGYGDPKARERENVARDVRLGYVSKGEAEEVYGALLGDEGAPA
jgi:N-methylhydantoinase B